MDQQNQPTIENSSIQPEGEIRQTPVIETPTPVQPEMPKPVEAVQDEVPKEAIMVQEQPPVAPVDPTAAVIAGDQTVQVQAPTQDEIAEEVGEEISPKEETWLSEAKHIMKEFEEKPYEEEEASEALQQKYMNQRFGVNIKKEKE